MRNLHDTGRHTSQMIDSIEHRDTAVRVSRTYLWTYRKHKDNTTPRDTFLALKMLSPGVVSCGLLCSPGDKVQLAGARKGVCAINQGV